MPATKSVSDQRRASGRQRSGVATATNGGATQAAAASATRTRGATKATATRAATAKATTSPTTNRTNGSGVDEAFLADLLSALRAARNGDFTVRLPSRRANLTGQIG